MAHFPSNAPALAGAADAIPSLPSRGAVRGALAVGTAELAVLLVRGTAGAILLSPALLVTFLLAG